MRKKTLIKIIVTGFGITFLGLILSFIFDFVAVLGPLMTDVSRKDLFDHAVSQLNIDVLVRRFYYILPPGFLFSLIFHLFYFKRFK
jgi:hypothetical protein